MTRSSRHAPFLPSVAVFLLLLFAAGLSPAMALLTVGGPACSGARALDGMPLGAVEAPDGPGEDQGADDVSVQSAGAPFAMPVAFLHPLGSKTPDLLLVRSLFRPPTAF